MTIPDNPPAVPLALAGRDRIMDETPPAAWRAGMPPRENYHLSAVAMPAQRTTHHPVGSLEQLVEQLVQGFELEVSHNGDPATWVTMAVDRFHSNVNGGPWFTAGDIAEQGSYNILIGDSVFYRRDEHDFAGQHDIFHRAFGEGFFWELLAVYSPPPTVAFSWRHWGRFTGAYCGFEPTGEVIEMFGMSLAVVDPDDGMKLTTVSHFYNPDAMLARLTGGRPVPPGYGGRPPADGCPVAHT